MMDEAQSDLFSNAGTLNFVQLLLADLHDDLRARLPGLGSWPTYPRHWVPAGR